MMVGPDWLMQEALLTGKDWQSARSIYRAFVLLRKNTGHVLDLDREESRRQLMNGFRHRRIAKCTVPCVRCHCVAWLGDWIKAADMTAKQRQAVVDDNPERAQARLLDFLVSCPGGNYKQVVYDKRKPPEVL